MNSSNSFNICPRCGNSNSLNAKYCSRCGAQLKVPTEAVVCHKCHTRNSSLANFCRNCGATLKVGAQTKICPRCGREIGAEENMCACGYSFVNMQQTEPRRADVSSTNRDKKRDKKRDKNRPVESDYNQTAPSDVKEKKTKPKKGGRGFALFAFLILAAFVVVILLPATARGPLADIDKGFYHPVEDAAEDTVDNAALLYAEGEEEGEGEQTGDGEQTGEPATPGENEGGEGEEPTEPVNPPSGNEGGEGEEPNEPVTPPSGNEGGEEGGDEPSTPVTPPSGSENEGNQSGNESGNTEGGNENGEGEVTYLDHNVYGWDFINDIIGLFEGELSLESITAYFGGSGLMMVALFAIFMLTAVFHLLVCIFRIISPKRSKRANLLYLILAVITTVLVLMMNFAHLIPNEESAFRLFFAPSYKGMTCEYGLMMWLIPIYYWFFCLYSCIAKLKTPKKEKKEKKAKNA